MPLRNRLDEVIRRYDRATSLVRQFQDGEMSEEELSSKFERLREERRSIDENNRVFLLEERMAQMGETTTDGSEACEDLTGSDAGEIDCESEEEDSEEEGGEASEEEEDSEEEFQSDSEEEEEGGICEDAEEENDVAMEPDGDNGAAVEGKKPRRQREDKLWEEYGSFWRST